MSRVPQLSRRFPATLRSMRMSRRKLQKSFAIELGIDAAVLCGVEKGTRGPLDDTLLGKASAALELNEQEDQRLRWSAHHDRLTIHLESRGASMEEIRLISSVLTAWHHMEATQRTGWLTNLHQVAESAVLLKAITNTPETEVAMS